MGDTSMIKVGPVGKHGIVWDEKGHSKIVQIFISEGDKIYSLQFQYVESENLVLSGTHGESTGDKFHTVKLNHPEEYLTSIKGWRDKRFIKSIAFHTNTRRHGPFGEHSKHDKEFLFELGLSNQFGGFHGSAAKGITSIGVYIKPTTISNANGRPPSNADSTPTLNADSRPTLNADTSPGEVVNQ